MFLTASDGRLNDRLHVYCYHRKDGRLLWHTRLFGSAPTDLYPAGGMAVPTPVTDGKHLYTLFGTGELVCLDARTGSQVWQTEKVTDLKSGASIHITPSGDGAFLYNDRGEVIRARLTASGYVEAGRTRLLEPTSTRRSPGRQAGAW